MYCCDDELLRRALSKLLEKYEKARNVRAEIDTKREALMRRTMACDERVKKCEKMIEIMQRSSERNLVVLSNRCLTTTIGVEEGEREERGRGGRVGLDYDYDFNDDLLTKMNGTIYDEDFRKQLGEVHRDRAKRRAIKDVEESAKRARRYGELALSLARELMEARPRNMTTYHRGLFEERDNKTSSSLVDVMPVRTAFYDCEELVSKSNKVRDEEEEKEDLDLDLNERFAKLL